MIASYCYGHKAKMEQRFSKTKKDEHGNPIAYFSHIDPDGEMCFGIGKPPEGEYKDTAEEIEQETMEKVKEFEEEIKEDKDEDLAPMKKSDWRRKDEMIARIAIAKEFIKRGEDFDNAKINSDLEKWMHFVLTGEIK